MSIKIFANIAIKSKRDFYLSSHFTQKKTFNRRVTLAEVRNDSEIGHNNYVRVLDPRAAEISFVRTTCARREAFYLGCSHLECGKQSAFGSDKAGVSLPKMAMPGDWPFHVALFRKDTHVCDGTLVSSHWVLTTASCFQGQSKATWIAIFGNVRIGVTTPWTQRRRIVCINIFTL